MALNIDGLYTGTVEQLLKRIVQELRSLQPVDSSTVRWSKGLAGMEANVVDELMVDTLKASPDDAAGGGGTETIININLYTQQWIIDVDAGTCTCTGGYIVVNNTVLINLAGSIVNFSADNNNEVLVCQINPDFSVQWVWGAPGASSVVAAKPSVVCFWLALGTSTPLRQNARFYEYVTYIATNPVIGV